MEKSIQLNIEGVKRMTSKLKWSNKARTEMLPTDSSFKDGNARWCGYVDLAMHIAKKPNSFHPEDQRKAKNILLSVRANKLASQIAEVQEQKT